MKVVPLTSSLEDKFWSHVYKDLLDYYFFIFDWTHNREQTKIFLALSDSDEIAGMMLLYMERIVQLRGSPEAAKSLIENLCPVSVEVSAPIECKNVLLDRLHKPTFVEEIFLLSLKKDQEHIAVSFEPQILHKRDAKAVCELMKQAYPEHWNDMTVDFLKEIFDETVWLGIKDGNRLAALGVAADYAIGHHIMFIATEAQYRNRGYATSIVSTFTKQILERSETVSIFVSKNNGPAIRSYTKVGFRPYKEYLYIKT